MTPNPRPPTDPWLRDLLLATRSVAVLGASPEATRPSHRVAGYLLGGTGYEVFLVNPNASQILGRPVYPSLGALPVRPDLVDVFRRPAELAGVLEEAVAVGASTLWLQLGLSDAAVAGRAEAAGLTIVMDRCLKIEHSRLVAAR